MSSFVITIHSQPFASDAIRSALSFCQAVVRQEHKLEAIFFYQDGVNIAHPHQEIPSDEFNAAEQFAKFSDEFSVPLLMCVTAAEKRGITTEVERLPFKVAGLAEFAAISSKVDRLVQFK